MLIRKTKLTFPFHCLNAVKVAERATHEVKIFEVNAFKSLQNEVTEQYYNHSLKIF